LTDLALDLDQIRQKGEESLYFFAKGILHYDWLVPHVHGPVCSALENHERTRKRFVLPRGWLKTTLCSISYPIWRAVKNPNVRILVAQNTSTNAKKKLREIQGQFEANPLLRALYPDLLPGRNSTWNAEGACLSRPRAYPEATFEACGVRTQITSRHYDVIIEDDTVAPDLDELGEEGVIIPSKDDIAQAIGWHRLVPPLLTDPGKGEILVVGTRWYEDDLMSWIGANEPYYLVIERACLEDEEGKPDRKGRITYPERFSEKVLEELEISQGPYLFDTLYLNYPVRTGEMVFKPEWVNYYDTPPPSKSLAVYTTVDPATDPELSKSRDTDFSVVITCGKDLNTGHIYVLDYFREKCNPGELTSAIFDHVVRYRPIEVGYEDVGFQRSLDYWLKELMREQGIYFILRPVKRGRRKDQKNLDIMGLQPVFASGAILVRTHMHELRTELLAFPRGKHDDVIDALAMQLQLWRATRIKEKPKALEDDHPLSFERAVRERRGRGKPGHTPIFDPLTFSGGVADAI
jgi:predicted phage terminase large subunit-like protein